MSLIQTPLNITVTRVVSRVMPASVPCQIINQSLTATVWAAQNSNVTAGLGTPISPGTSLTWTSEGPDFYLILGTDTDSVAAGSSAVVISYDVADWQPNPVAVATAILNSGVLVIDNPSLIYSNVLNGITPRFDVRRYNSLNVTVEVNAASTPATLGIQWFADSAGTVFMGADELYIYGPLTINGIGNQPPRWNGTIPIKGAYFNMTTSNNMTINVVASYRLVDTIINTLSTLSSNNLLLDHTDTAVAAGGNGALVYSEPYFGLVHVMANGASPAVGQFFTVFTRGAPAGLDYRLDVSGAANVQTGSQTYTVGASGWSEWVLPCWGKQLGFQAVNPAGAARNFFIRVAPYQGR